MPRKKKRAVEAERQNFYYLIYEMIGTGRTLKKVHKLASGIGSRVALKTLQHYSAKYNWQSRLLERAARQEAAPMIEAKELLVKINQDHYQIFEDIGKLVKAGIRYHKKQIALSEQAGLGDVLEIPVTYLGKMAEYVQRGQRIASGQATDRIEVVYEVMAPVVKEIMAVFLAVNYISKDPPELVQRRKVEFIKRGDAILEGYYEQTKLLGRGK
jgi:hypothetical protein